MCVGDLLLGAAHTLYVSPSPRGVCRGEGDVDKCRKHGTTPLRNSWLSRCPKVHNDKEKESLEESGTHPTRGKRPFRHERTLPYRRRRTALRPRQNQRLRPCSGTRCQGPRKRPPPPARSAAQSLKPPSAAASWLRRPRTEERGDVSKSPEDTRRLRRSSRSWRLGPRLLSWCAAGGLERGMPDRSVGALTSVPSSPQTSSGRTAASPATAARCERITATPASARPAHGPAWGPVSVAGLCERETERAEGRCDARPGHARASL